MSAATARENARPVIGVVGDVLLDRDVEGSVTRLCPDAPVPVVDVDVVRESPGGAGLAALLCAGSAEVVLVAPLADDDGGRTLRRQLGHVVTLPLGHEGATRRKTRIRSAGQSLVRVDDGGPGTPRDVDRDRVAAALAACDAVLVADYGGGTTTDPVVRGVLAEIARDRPVVWDPHPRGGPPVPGVTLVTPNLAEAAAAVARAGTTAGSSAGSSAEIRDIAPDDAAGLAAALVTAWSAGAVCVTSGARGAHLAHTRPDASAGHVPAVPVAGGDPCGAGDRFAATAVDALARGRSVGEAVTTAVEAAGAWVAAGGAAGFRRSAGDPSRTGVLVATGGCFDLLHAGHVSTLQAARALGDRLVVLVNSDESVRRLKGPGRPVVPAADRVRVLEALECVDATIVFDGDDPREALGHLRPDVWVKGGDYTVDGLPEAGVVAAHGGSTVVLPYLDGLSTTAILERARTADPTSLSLG